MKKSLLSLSLIFAAMTSIAQTNATDFTANDCDGVSHNLFSELESGKIIVMSWVMPCGGCIVPARSAYNVAQTFEIDYPGRVVYYVVDDYANTSCTSLASWANTTASMPNSTKFSNSTISMSDYGTDGMPKIVVIGGADHKIYYNVNNLNDGQGVEDAIELALLENPTGVNGITSTNFFLDVYPNPLEGNNITLNYFLPESAAVSFEIYNTTGQLILSENSGMQFSGLYVIQMDLAKLEKGIYFIRLNAGTRNVVRKIIV
jgi:hypothetical protein